MSEVNCRGSIALGTGCKRCDRCLQEINDLGDPANENTARVVDEAQAVFNHLFAWISAGTPAENDDRCWTRSGFVARQMKQSPVGPFYYITKGDTGLHVYRRPRAPACVGWLKRIDLRGETTLHSLHTAARVADSCDPTEAAPQPPTAPQPGVLWLSKGGTEGRLVLAIIAADPEPLVFYRPHMPPDVLTRLSDWNKWVDRMAATERPGRQLK